MPEAPRSARPLARHRDVYTEADGLFGRLADLVIENPARSGGFVAVLLVTGAIVTNAAFFQTVRHPDPFFATRTAPVEAPAAAAVPATPDANPAAGPEAAQPAVPHAALPPPPGPPAAAIANAIPPPVLPKARPASQAAAKAAVPARLAPSVAATPAAPPTAGLVADTQRALAASHYYDGPADGILGPATRSAISGFEMKIGLIPTGQPSPQLLQQIRKGYPAIAAPASTGSIGAPDPRLKRIQHALNEIGYGPVPEDGRDGAKTAAAIRRFEIDNRLPPTGRAGDAVSAKLVLIGAMAPI